jgi:hypothetical protein
MHELTREVFGTNLGVMDETFPDGLFQCTQYVLAASGAVAVITIEVCMHA